MRLRTLCGVSAAIEIVSARRSWRVELHSNRTTVGKASEKDIAQRIQARAQPDEVLVSRTVADLIGGSHRVR
jgi:hypothetical protein